MLTCVWNAAHVLKQNRSLVLTLFSFPFHFNSGPLNPSAVHCLFTYSLTSFTRTCIVNNTQSGSLLVSFVFFVCDFVVLVAVVYSNVKKSILCSFRHVRPWIYSPLSSESHINDIFLSELTLTELVGANRSVKILVIIISCVIFPLLILLGTYFKIFVILYFINIHFCCVLTSLENHCLVVSFPFEKCPVFRLIQVSVIILSVCVLNVDCVVLTLTTCESQKIDTFLECFESKCSEKKM